MSIRGWVLGVTAVDPARGEDDPGLVRLRALARAKPS